MTKPWTDLPDHVPGNLERIPAKVPSVAVEVPLEGDIRFVWTVETNDDVDRLIAWVSSRKRLIEALDTLADEIAGRPELILTRALRT
jgi:hypothetical protein